MATIATIWVKLGLDSRDYDKGLKDATRGTQTADKSLSKGLAGGIAQYAALASAATAAAAVIWDFTQTASDLEESINKVNVVFGDSAAEIQRWSMDTANSMGISRQAALEAVGTYGNLFTSLGLTQGAASDMSRSLVGLAADMASFNNADPTDVLMALRSGLSGEIEPLKKFGIAMNEVILKQKAMELGLGDTIQALTEAEKIQVRYAVIMDQTANAQGDFARTSDGLANTQRQLAANWEDIKAILGEEFLPAITEAAGEVLQLTRWVKENAEEIKKWANILSWANPGKWGVEIGKAARNLFEMSDATKESEEAIKEADGAIDGWMAGLQQAPAVVDAVTNSVKDSEKALKAQSEAYKTILSNMFKIQDANDRFIDDEGRRAEKQKELEDEKVRAVLESGEKQKDMKRDLKELDRDIAKARAKEAKTEEQQAAKTERIHDLNVRRAELLERIADAQQSAAVTQVQIDEKLAKLEEEKTEAIEDQADARKQLVFDMLEQKAAQDGIIDTDEIRFLQDTAVQMGLVDRASADMAIAASEAADMMWQGFQKPGEAVGDIQAALDRVVKGSPYRAQIVIETIGGTSSIPAMTSSFLNSIPVSSGGLSNMPGFQEGAENFVVPPGFPNDSFVAGFTSGETLNVTPAGGGNSEKNVNITIYPTITEPQDWDFVTQEIARRLTS